MGSAPSTSRRETAGTLGPVLHPGPTPSPRRARRLRLAVRLWRRPDSRGQGWGRRRRRGADCLVIDAEGQYEGKYAAAETYIRALRARDRSDLPALPCRLSLRRLPPGVSLLGLLWARRRHLQPAADVLEGNRDLGRAVFAHTYLYNRLWGHPIFPLGQTYESPGRGQFCVSAVWLRATAGRRAGGIGRKRARAAWAALGADPAGPLSGFQPGHSQPVLRLGESRRPGRLGSGAPAHRRSARASLSAGSSARATVVAVRAFQSGHGLSPDGVIGTSTWRALLNFAPAQWTGRGGRRVLCNRSFGQSGGEGKASALGVFAAKADEIPPLPRP